MTVDYTDDTAVFTWEAKIEDREKPFSYLMRWQHSKIQVSLLVDGKERDLNPLHIEYLEHDGRETKLMCGKLEQQTMTPAIP